MATTCPYCNIEVRESAIEAEDGCCPECGAQISVVSSLLDDPDADYLDYDDENDDVFSDLDDDEDDGNDFARRDLDDDDAIYDDNIGEGFEDDMDEFAEDDIFDDEIDPDEDDEDEDSSKWDD